MSASNEVFRLYLKMKILIANEYSHCTQWNYLYFCEEKKEEVVDIFITTFNGCVHVSEDLNLNDIKGSVNTFISIYLSEDFQVFKVRKHGQRCKINQSLWWDQECELAKA